MLQAQRLALCPTLVMHSCVVTLLSISISKPGVVSSFLRSTVSKTLSKGISPWAATLSRSGETLNAEHRLDWLQPAKKITRSHSSRWGFPKEKKCKLQDENTNYPFLIRENHVRFSSEVETLKILSSSFFSSYQEDRKDAGLLRTGIRKANSGLPYDQQEAVRLVRNLTEETKLSIDCRLDWQWGRAWGSGAKRQPLQSWFW